MDAAYTFEVFVCCWSGNKIQSPDDHNQMPGVTLFIFLLAVYASVSHVGFFCGQASLWRFGNRQIVCEGK